LALKVDFTEKELIENINTTIQDEEHKKVLLELIRIRKIIPIKKDCEE
jgi:hypothetical protein